MIISELCREIASRWPATIRTMPEAHDDFIAMPTPYIVPCARNSFQEYYYWDTYFACRGLALQGFSSLVKSCCDNLISLVERYGFVPNGGRLRYLNRSQPPVLSLLIDMVRITHPNQTWRRRALAALKKEHEFWMTKRLLPIGLNHYGYHEPVGDLAEFGRYVAQRLKIEEPPDRQRLLEFAAQSLAEAESGWDFNPRFERHCQDFAAVDLNALLGACEREIMILAHELKDQATAADYEKLFHERQERLRYYCWSDQRGVFVDYDARNERRGTLISGAALWPLWLQLASPAEAEATAHAVAQYLEYPCGLAACEKKPSAIVYQWNYPNAWPPVQLAAIEGFRNYGFDTASQRIAEKYLTTVLRGYEQTDELWEKYNCVDGTVHVGDEYPMPPMLGWTAGVFVVAAAMKERNFK